MPSVQLGLLVVFVAVMLMVARVTAGVTLAPGGESPDRTVLFNAATQFGAMALAGSPPVRDGALPTHQQSPHTSPAVGDRAPFSRLSASFQDNDLDVRFMEFAPDGTLWLRVRSEIAVDTVLAVESPSSISVFRGLRSAVQAAHNRVVGYGTLSDFWAVDGADRVWVGGAFYDGTRWTELVENSDTGGTEMQYEDRVALDESGLAWVPFRVDTGCPGFDGCTTFGIDALRVDGPSEERIDLGVVAALAAADLPFVRLLKSSEGALAVGPHGMYLLPSGQERVYPSFDASTDSAGFASVAALRPDRTAEVFVWRERWDGQAIRREVVSEVWSGTRWISSDLSSAPLFASAQEPPFATAAAYAPDGTLWLATSNGEMSSTRSGVWDTVYGPTNSPLSGTIRDIAVGSDGSVFVATSDGVSRLGLDGSWTDPIPPLPSGTPNAVYLPSTFKDTMSRKPPQQTIRDIEVSSTQPWQATSVVLREGDEYTVEYQSGLWTVDERQPGGLPFVGPGGYADTRPCVVLASSPFGGLLGYIGNAPPTPVPDGIAGLTPSEETAFFVGAEGTFNARFDGELFFRINDKDDCLSDNGGSVIMKVLSP